MSRMANSHSAVADDGPGAPRRCDNGPVDDVAAAPEWPPPEPSVPSPATRPSSGFLPPSGTSFRGLVDWWFRPVIEARSWLARLLQDPSEKIRRYAMAAMPKIGAGRREESELLSLLKTTTVEREKKFLCRALDKIGGTATLEVVVGARGLLPQTEQKVKARVARKQRPSAIRMDSALLQFAGLRVHLRCRKGLETIVRDEVEERIGPKGKFRIAEVRNGLVAINPVEPFSLADIYTLRCFGTANFVLGTVRSGTPDGIRHSGRTVRDAAGVQPSLPRDRAGLQSVPGAHAVIPGALTWGWATDTPELCLAFFAMHPPRVIQARPRF